ncbi:hypothetical protein AURDEDRAFT_111009 [Auricularia subglabra TFB-10046 SS5]|nr:hypothetical protein AURDEDRAFT_111009 [Auricularia subglabra TFB-10046 SS5]
MRKRKADALSDDEDMDPTPRKLPAQPDQSGNVDYSVFKGHGRYRTSLPGSDAPAQHINQLYEINQDANDGVGFQYNEVVRNKQKRKQLDGGDCECCRDYYAAVGPLPPRMQPPRWRSPSESQSQTRTRGPCRHTHQGQDDGHAPDSFEEEGVAGPSSTAAAIAAHKNEISKHRHAWAPAETPPDYWHIGFPTTQEVNDINKKAARMHEQKMLHVAAEASKPGGKYKKKGR